MLSLDQFRDRIVTPERLEKLFELNPNRKEYIEKMSPDFDYRYIVIEDALMNPYDVRDFLINGAYMAGTNDLNPTKTGAPGMQQPVANEWANHIFNTFVIFCSIKRLLPKILPGTIFIATTMSSGKG